MIHFLKKIDFSYFHDISLIFNPIDYSNVQISTYFASANLALISSFIRFCPDRMYSTHMY